MNDKEPTTGDILLRGDPGRMNTDGVEPVNVVGLPDSSTVADEPKNVS